MEPGWGVRWVGTSPAVPMGDTVGTQGRWQSAGLGYRALSAREGGGGGSSRPRPGSHEPRNQLRAGAHGPGERIWGRALRANGPTGLVWDGEGGWSFRDCDTSQGRRGPPWGGGGGQDQELWGRPPPQPLAGRGRPRVAVAGGPRTGRARTPGTQRGWPGRQINGASAPRACPCDAAPGTQSQAALPVRAPAAPPRAPRTSSPISGGGGEGGRSVRLALPGARNVLIGEGGWGTAALPW